jgi:hypothetical protein
MIAESIVSSLLPQNFMPLIAIGIQDVYAVPELLTLYATSK